MTTNIDRWQELAVSEKNPSWADRNRVVASLIPQGSTVLDIGAGNRVLQTLLPDNCQYQPMDCVKGSDDTIVYDFNITGEPPILPIYDIVVCSGVMEYIYNVEQFISTIKTYGKTIILTYALFEYRSKEAKDKPEINGWVNALDLEDLKFILSNYDIEIVQTHKWNSHMIFVLTH